MDGFEQLKKQLLAMNYDAAHVDEVIARMRAEEEFETRQPVTVQDDARTSSDDG